MRWLRALATGRSDEVGTRLELAKAKSALAEAQAPKPQIHNLDPLSWGHWGNDIGDGASAIYSAFHPGTVGLSFAQIDEMVRVWVIAGIIQTRIGQYQPFCQPQANPHAPGFIVRLEDRKAKMSRAAEKTAREITEVLLRGGGKYGYGSMNLAMSAILRDSLSYDQCVFEPLRERGGKPCGYYPGDAAFFRLALPPNAAIEQGQWYPDSAPYVEIESTGTVMREWERDELVFGIRRPRTGRRVGRYGFPEADELIRIITDLVNAELSNSVKFTSGVGANHIVALISDMDIGPWTAFRRAVTTMLSGVRNAGKTPMVQLSARSKEDLKVLQLQKPDDMAHKEWINFRTKAACALYGMDPAELGFVFGNEGQSGSMGGQSSVEKRIIYSKEKGLAPLLSQAASWLTRGVIKAWKPWEDFCVEHVGLNALTEAEQLELDIKTVRAFKTVNELRAEKDLKPLKDSKVAELPLDQQFREEAMGQPGADEGVPGEGPGGFGDEDPNAPPIAPAGFAADEFGKGTLSIADVDGWTRALVESGERAIDRGEIRVVQKGMHRRGGNVRMVRAPASERKQGVRAFIVEVD